MKKITTLILLLISTFGFSQEYKLEDAQITKTDFLQALKILDLPEGNELLAELVFETNNSYPVVSSSNLIFEKLFDTDINGIKGYKALLEIQTLSKANTPLTIRYILISYLVKKENKWKVFEFRQSIDVEREILNAKSDLDKKSKYLELQYKLRGLAYWQMLNGELLESKNNFLKAYKVAKSKGDDEFNIPTYLVLDSIVDFENLNKID
ncbi:MAG TPA: hypothetical protein DER05_11715 [Lutibacter sp.]|nr:hypothetical protein [Lutibacter sp.]